jgi:hypothetical protein
MLSGMAREEQNREDVLREATALVERVELAPAAGFAGEGERAVVGFRADGSLSVFFGAEPVYQFNSRRELRRAYADGLLYKAERGRLVSLERVRHLQEVQLLRRELSESAQADFLTAAQQRLRTLADHVERQMLVSVGQVPAEADVLGRFREWMCCLTAIVIAQSPRVG